MENFTVNLNQNVVASNRVGIGIADFLKKKLKNFRQNYSLSTSKR